MYSIKIKLNNEKKKKAWFQILYLYRPLEKNKKNKVMYKRLSVIGLITIGGSVKSSVECAKIGRAFCPDCSTNSLGYGMSLLVIGLCV